MDDQQAKMVDEAAQKFAEAIMLMNRTWARVVRLRPKISWRGLPEASPRE